MWQQVVVGYLTVQLFVEQQFAPGQNLAKQEIGRVCFDEAIVDRVAGTGCGRAEAAGLASGRDDAEGLVVGMADNELKLDPSSGSLSLSCAK